MSEQTWRIELGAAERRWRRRFRIVIAISAVVALLPTAVLAATTFTDVPPSHTFRTDISRVAEAGITAGCGGGKYCPDAEVTRGQMAAFLARTGSRAAYGPYTQGDPLPTLSNDANAPTALTSVTVKAGNVKGGTAFVTLIGSVGSYVWAETGLPVRSVFWVREVGTTAAHGMISSQIDAFDEPTGGVGTNNATVVAVVPVSTGVDHTFELVGWRIGSTSVSAYANLAAIVTPFSEDGDAVLNP